VLHVNVCVCVQRVMQAKQMLDRLRACVVASYYGRVVHSSQLVSHSSLTMTRIVTHLVPQLNHQQAHCSTVVSSHMIP